MTQNTTDREAAVQLPPEGCVIEFFGLPGSGKTTTARALYLQMRDAGHTVTFAPELTGDEFTKWKRNAIRLGLILRALPRTWKRIPLLLDTFRVPQKAFIDKLKAVYNSWTVLSVLAIAQPRSGYLIFDQGIAQATWSVLLNAARDDADFLLDEYSSEPCWHVVMLDLSVEKLKTRLKLRPQKHSRLQKTAGSSADALWIRAETLAVRIATALDAQNNTTVQHLTSDNHAPENLANQVLEQLDQTNRQRTPDAAVN